MGRPELMNIDKQITVIIPTSPSPKHPSTQLLEDCIDSIRKHLPVVECIVQMDGIRTENENRRVAYEEYRRRVHWLAQNKYEGVLVLEFPEYRHQAEMMRESFEYIKTPLLFYLEWDWVILPDPIDWEGMVRAITASQLNYIRLCRWDTVHPEHEYLMCGREEFSGLPVVKTIQWSGHPHLASTAFYERLIAQFRVGCRTLIEEFIYGPVVNAPWEEYKCCIYNPLGSMKRIFHTDGRESDPKFDAQF